MRQLQRVVTSAASRCAGGVSGIGGQLGGLAELHGM